MKKTVILLLAVIFALGAVPAMASFTIDLYATVDNTPTGTPTKTPPAVVLPESTTWGFVYIYEDTILTGNLSDMLWFRETAPNNGRATTVQLYVNPEFADPLAAYDAYILAGRSVPRANILSAVFPDPTIYEAACSQCPNPNTYRIHGYVPPVPVPTSLLLLGSALLGLMGWRSKN